MGTSSASIRTGKGKDEIVSEMIKDVLHRLFHNPVNRPEVAGEVI
jgi:hypothetical protein